MTEQKKCGNCLTNMDAATCRVCGFESPLVVAAVRNFESARSAWQRHAEARILTESEFAYAYGKVDTCSVCGGPKPCELDDSTAAYAAAIGRAFGGLVN